MNISKTISTVGVGAAIVVGSMFAVNAVGAHSGGDVSDDRAAAIAEKLGVNSDQVKEAFEEIHAEKKAEREEQKAEHLAGLIADGTLTQEQADALQAKHEELREAKEALKEQDLTREEIREQMQEAKDEFRAWAEEQGIDLEEIRPEGGREGHKGGHRGGFGG